MGLQLPSVEGRASSRPAGLWRDALRRVLPCSRPRRSVALHNRTVRRAGCHAHAAVGMSMSFPSAAGTCSRKRAREPAYRRQAWHRTLDVPRAGGSRQHVQNPALRAGTCTPYGPLPLVLVSRRGPPAGLVIACPARAGWRVSEGGRCRVSGVG